MFAFARCVSPVQYLVLHLELTGAINQRADLSHPRWSLVLSQA
jgi:hypothetical protein